jgi:hypothetical protein
MTHSFNLFAVSKPNFTNREELSFYKENTK